jgi:hypothetical protein
MLTRIVHNSPSLCTFFEQLDIRLLQRQQRHILNMADALLVCEADKTLAALQRQFVEAPDSSNMADFLRISPWSATAVRSAIREQQVGWLLAEAERSGAAKIIYLNLDDSLGEKDKETRHLQVVDWHHDHSESTKKQPRYQNAFCYLACTLRVGDMVATVDLRLYLREKTVRRLNRYRAKADRLHFRSKNSLARLILADLRPLLPRPDQGWQVYVQFDSWYASERLLKYVRRQGWHVVCGLKHNRKLNDIRLDTHDRSLRHRRYTSVRVAAADGHKRTYHVRQQVGRLNNVPYDIRVFFSRRHPRERFPAYIACTDLACSAQQALQGYSWRWSCEVVNFYLKTQLGLADFRVQSYEAVDRYMVVVHLAWAYVEYRFTQQRSASIQTYGDLIRQHRDEHAIAWLTEAVQLAAESGDTQLVLRHFLRLDSQPA